MSSRSQHVFVDSEVAPQILLLINEAKKFIVLVTPYLKLDDWNHAQLAIHSAIDRGVQITVLVRDEDAVVDSETVEWLLEANAKVLCVEYLHAKIYLNEATTLVSSMNLYNFSAQNSLEIAVIIRDKTDAQRIRDYVFNTLKTIAEPVEVPAIPARSLKARQSTREAEGSCIRCGSDIEFDSSRPLCRNCYGIWAEFENEDYQESFCHSCGKPSRTTFARPLCNPCYRKAG